MAFVKLVPNEQVVEVVEFETADPALRGEMTITITLADADGGTEILAVHDGLPNGVPAADNEAGWRSSLAKLAIVLGKRAVTTDTALRLARYFGTSERFWLGLQMDFDLEEAKHRGMHGLP